MEKEENLKQETTEKETSNKEVKKEVAENSEVQDSTAQEVSSEEKIKELEDKVIRTFAEMENQRRRFEKEKEDAFEYVVMLLQKKL